MSTTLIPVIGVLAALFMFRVLYALYLDSRRGRSRHSVYSEGSRLAVTQADSGKTVRFAFELSPACGIGRQAESHDSDGDVIEFPTPIRRAGRR